MSLTTNKMLRTVKSFVRREGRNSATKQVVWDKYWPVYGIDLVESCTNIAASNIPVVLEIGFGDGRSLVEMATKEPGHHFIGIEVYKTGIIKLLSAAVEKGLKNLQVVCHDAVEVLQNNIADNSLERVQLFFPDPWPKKKHHKRRIVQPDFVELLAKKLRVGGTLHMATDWQHYADHMLKVLEDSTSFKNCFGKQQFATNKNNRSITKFEQRGCKLGHGVWDLVFCKI